MNGKFLLLNIALITAVLSASGCGNLPAVGPAPAPISTSVPTEMPAPTTKPSTGPQIMVAFVKDGNIQLWDESTGQSKTILNAGDVIAVKMSDDGQVIAFLRRSGVQLAENEWREQAALWAIDENGANPRELISAESLRQRLNAAERDSTNIPQMEWIPGTHQLLFTGWTYFVQAEGESHAIPQGLYLVDADAVTDKELVPAGSNLRFVPSPDGRQIALMSTNALSFINVDGSNLRSDVLTYPQVGLTAPLFPTGVWTGDSSAFVITGSLENDPGYNINFTVWRVPVDGSSPESLATVTKSDPRSATFSPDGTRMAFLQATDGQPPTIAGWFVTALAGNARPLAIPSDFETWIASLHWSPAGDPFTGNLKKLCPEATSNSDICDDRIHFDGTVAAVHWIDGNRVLILTQNPSVLFLGKMDFTGNMDGITIPIATWPVNDWVNLKSFTTAKVIR